LIRWRSELSQSQNALDVGEIYASEGGGSGREDGRTIKVKLVGDPLIDQVLKFLGEIVVYGGGSVAIAYLAFQKFGEKWIQNKFDKSLEAYKHQQNLEIQRLRVEIDSMLSRVLKIQEKEFEVLPEAWNKLDEVYFKIMGLVSPVQMTPDIDGMNEFHLEEFLSKIDLPESKKNEIRSSPYRSDVYSEAIFWKKLNEAKFAIGEFQKYVGKNSIFLPTSLKKAFEDFSKSLSSVLIEKEVGKEANDHKMEFSSFEKLQKEVEPLYKSIETEIQSRLHPHGN
jgi:hypothetical protein